MREIFWVDRTQTFIDVFYESAFLCESEIHDESETASILLWAHTAIQEWRRHESIDGTWGAARARLEGSVATSSLDAVERLIERKTSVRMGPLKAR